MITTNTVTSGSMEISWAAAQRLATVCFGPNTHLTGNDGAVLVDALGSWIGMGRAPFGLLADAQGVCGTNAEYRATAHGFFHDHRDEATVAVFNAGAAIQIVIEMFRIGSGVQVKAFADESAARSWLQRRGGSS